MKLRQFRVRDFRSIRDSGPIYVDEQTTCLVGKNEAGKTALLDALYRTNPIIPDKNVFELIYDYPKSDIEDYRVAIENNEREEVIVVECLYELEEDDIGAISSVFGEAALIEKIFTHKCYYGKNDYSFEIKIDEAAARKHLRGDSALPDELRTNLEDADDWITFEKVLREAEATEKVKQLIILINNVQKNGLDSYIMESLIWPRAPKYLYFDEYYQMKGQENLNALIKREKENKLLDSDHPLLGLINLARLDHHQLVDTKKTTDLKNKLEGAGNHLTKRIIKYWSQNQHIKIQFDVRDGKSEDPEGMQTGINIWAEVYDTVHWAHTPLGSRSRGFVWFFSFLAWYEDLKNKSKNVILLLDEPGLSLHGRAQADLLNYFESELARHQLLYTTHSPFMIDPKKFERVRIVQDRSIDAKEPLPKDEDGTKVLTDVFAATDDSLFPLQGALGYEIQQTLFIGPNSLIVEGPADMLYIQAVSAQLEREGRIGLSEDWVITPVGGSGKVPTFVALLAPQKGMNVATLLDIQNQDRPLIEDLYKKKLLKKKQVLTYADFSNQNEADIEDIFERDFYVKIVNHEFTNEMSVPLDATKLSKNQPRTLLAIEAYFKDHPFKTGRFGHYRPARYFSEKIDALWPNISNVTKDQFENMFKQLNDLLK